MPSHGSSSLVAAKVTKRYAAFLPDGARVINYANKATGEPCMICGHEPEKRPPKPGYEHVSEEMRLMRVKLKEGTKAEDVNIGRKDFTVTGNLIELNVCMDVSNCRERAAKLTNPDGSPKYDNLILARLR